MACCIKDIKIELFVVCVSITAGILTFSYYLYMLYQLVYPRIIRYPWMFPSQENQRRREKKYTVIMAGSYNPPHKGHLAMLEYLSQRYGQVIAVIGINPNKKYTVSPATRADLLHRMIECTILVKKKDEVCEEKNIRVEIVSEYIWRYGMRHGVKILFRGIRTWEKDGRDERSLQKLNLWGPMIFGPLRWPIPTVYLEGVPEYRNISSSMIRALCIEDKGRKNENSEKVTNRFDCHRKGSDKRSHTSEDHFLASYIPEQLTEDVARAYRVT